MGRGTFRSRNKVGETFSFQTDSNNSTFSPQVTFLSGSDRVSWDLDEGGGYVAGNHILGYVYLDTGTTKTVTLRTNKLSNLNRCIVTNDDIIGQLDMSGWDNLGDVFWTYNNFSLTGITHTVSTQVFNQYHTYNCNLTGNHDMSMLPGLGGYFRISTNPLLTGITHTASTELITKYYAQSCGLVGNHDVSMLTGLAGDFLMQGNLLLTGITNPTSTGHFDNYSIHSCDLNYVNFLPLSGASFFAANIYLYDNSMSVTDVNHILVDFDNISTNLYPGGWGSVTLDISGTNAAPDSSSGGFNGIAALSSLTGGTNNWTITIS